MHAWPPLRSRGRKQPACQGSSPVGAERLAFRATEAVGHFCNRGEKGTIGGLGALKIASVISQVLRDRSRG